MDSRLNKMGFLSVIKYKAKVDCQLQSDATMTQRQTLPIKTQRVSSLAARTPMIITQNKVTPFKLQFQLQVIEEF